MKTHIIEGPLTYDGTQLASHWIYKNTGVMGDAAVAFRGGCDVKIDSMVDLADVLDNKSIFSHEMLHFIAEFFEDDLSKVIAWQRLFICIIKEVIEELNPGAKILRKGDDLFIKDESGGLRKLTVSIATKSAVSCLMHTGVNIRSDGTPVPAAGLNDLGIDPLDAAGLILDNFAGESESMKKARSKVRPVD